MMGRGLLVIYLYGPLLICFYVRVIYVRVDALEPIDRTFVIVIYLIN